MTYAPIAFLFGRELELLEALWGDNGRQSLEIIRVLIDCPNQDTGKALAIRKINFLLECFFVILVKLAPPVTFESCWDDLQKKPIDPDSR